MHMPRSRILTSFAVGFVALFPVACSGSSGGGGGGEPVSLSAPTAGSVLGNWAVVASSIQVISDPGVKHDLQDGNPFRIGHGGVEVLAGVYILPGGVLERLTKTVGGSYQLSTQAQAASFTCKLVIDTSAQGVPRGTDFLSIECDGKVVGSQLEITKYLLRLVEDGREIDRDELRFVCQAGPAVPSDMTGRWLITDIRVIEDTGPKHFLGVNSVLLDVQGAVVASVLGLEFSARAILDALGGNFDILDLYSNARFGRVEGMLLVRGRAGTSAADAGALLTFDFIHTGTHLRGEWFFLAFKGLNENVDDLDVTMIPRSGMQARLYQDAASEDAASEGTVDLPLPAPEKKLFGFLSEALQRRDR